MKVSGSLPISYSKQLFVMLVLCFFAIHSAMAEQAPAEIAKLQLVEVSSNAKSAVSTAGNLLESDEFVDTLKRILRDGTLTTLDRIDAFYLMQREIGWGFNGTLSMHPGISYFDFFVGQIYTYSKYRDALHGLGIDATPFIEFSEAKRNEDEARAAASLLLSSLIDPGKSVATIRKTLGIVSDETPILLHFATQAAVLGQDESLAQPIADLLLRLNSEETKEDAISALTCFSNAVAYHGVSNFVMSNAVRPFDQEMETAILALKSRMQPAVFSEFYAELKNRTSDEKALKALNEFEESGFRYTLTRPARFAVKLWDQFAMVVYDDGYLVERSGKKDFVSYKR